ncbi:MAG: hypothetical protein P9M14_04255 [Candidatus Alcyoniella australis]|nr:hypothetical protein [Candidatus Alcyoniella australis]
MKVKRLALVLFLSALVACACLLGACSQGDDDDDADDDDLLDDDDAADDDDDASSPDPQTADDRITLELIPGCNPFATSDECVLPYPSSFFQIDDPNSATGVRNNYPDDMLPVPPDMPPFDLGPTNDADGVSTAGPILLHFAADVDPDDLTFADELDESVALDSPIALFDIETGERLLFMSEMDANRKESRPDRYALILRPMSPMEMGHRHVIALTNELNDVDGAPFTSPPAFVALRDGVLTNNPEIEAVRERYELIFAMLEENGYQRDELLLAWDFMVASKDFLLGSILSMREEALNAGDLGYTITRIQVDPNQWAAKVIEGTFEVPTFLNENSVFDYDGLHHPIRQETNQSFPFTMVIPKQARTLGEPLPLMIFGHGLFGSGRSYLNGWAAKYIQPLAEENGIVIIATDWIGLSAGDMNMILENVITDLNNISLVTDRLQQSLINNLTLTELALNQLSTDPDVMVTEEALLDPDRVYYYGVSLGGIQGSSFVSISDRVSRGVFAVPGSVWLNMFTRSINWLPVKLVLDLKYPDPLAQQIGIALIQSRFDLSDPVNLTRLLYYEPLPDAPPDRVTLIQESIGDCQVPNIATEMLARSTGAALIQPSIYPVYGLNIIPSPTTAPVMVQYHLVEQAQANPPPESNVPPTVDNNVHSDVVFLPHVMQQVSHLLATGEVVQYCDGPCDPD